LKFKIYYSQKSFLIVDLSFFITIFKTKKAKMFNGLIREIASVISFKNNTLRLKAHYKPRLNDSIAVNGACLTATKIFEDGFELELSKESSSHIALENLHSQVHIEPAMCLKDRIDGHLMQGHIDGVGIISRIEEVKMGKNFFIQIPPDLMPFISAKGSIGIDGLSLTVNEVFKESIRLTIIPATLKESLFSTYKIGRRVNIETDMIARYLARLLEFKAPKNAKNNDKKALSWDEVEKISFLY